MYGYEIRIGDKVLEGGFESREMARKVMVEMIFKGLVNDLSGDDPARLMQATLLTNVLDTLLCVDEEMYLKTCKEVEDKFIFPERIQSGDRDDSRISG